MCKKVVQFIIIAFLHFCVTSLSWAFAPGNAAVGTSKLFSVLWQILSFPLVTLFPEISDTIGIPIMFFNSCLWAILALFAFQYYKKKKI